MHKEMGPSCVAIDDLRNNAGPKDTIGRVSRVCRLTYGLGSVYCRLALAGLAFWGRFAVRAQRPSSCRIAIRVVIRASTATCHGLGNCRNGFFMLNDVFAEGAIAVRKVASIFLSRQRVSGRGSSVQ
jgi:hypothetical protein